MIVLIAAFAVLLHYSRFGRSVYDIGLNDEVARFSGVNVERTKFWLFVLSGAVAGFAGVYFTLRYGSARGDNAMGLELEVIAAVLLGGVSIFGGRGALHGVVAGVLLIGVISSAMRLENQPVNLISIVTGVLLILSVLSVRINVWLRSRSRRSSGPGSATRASTEPPAGSEPATDTPGSNPRPVPDQPDHTHDYRFHYSNTDERSERRCSTYDELPQPPPQPLPSRCPWPPAVAVTTAVPAEMRWPSPSCRRTWAIPTSRSAMPAVRLPSPSSVAPT